MTFYDIIHKNPRANQKKASATLLLTSSQATQKVVYMAMKHVYQTTCSMLGIKTMLEFDPRFLF